MRFTLILSANIWLCEHLLFVKILWTLSWNFFLYIYIYINRFLFEDEGCCDFLLLFSHDYFQLLRIKNPNFCTIFMNIGIKIMTFTCINVVTKWRSKVSLILWHISVLDMCTCWNCTWPNPRIVRCPNLKFTFNCLAWIQLKPFCDLFYPEQTPICCKMIHSVHFDK